MTIKYKRIERNSEDVTSLHVFLYIYISMYRDAFYSYYIGGRGWGNDLNLKKYHWTYVRANVAGIAYAKHYRRIDRYSEDVYNLI